MSAVVALCLSICTACSGARFVHINWQSITVYFAFIILRLCCNLLLPSYRIKFGDSSSSTSTTSSRIEYYCHDRDLPIYSKRTSGYPFDQLVKILMPSGVDETMVCSVRPVGVSANARFIVDIEKVHFNDLKCDDLGTFGQQLAQSPHSSDLPPPVLKYLRRNLLKVVCTMS